MKFYRLIIGYDGTDFCGWQSQKDEVTVQTSIKDAFERAFKKDGHVFAASRTDTGVHARGQVARLYTLLDMPAEKIKTVLNSALPKSITIFDVLKVEKSFNPHEGIEHKEYRYRIFTKKPDPFSARFGWLPAAPDKVNWDQFQETLKVFEGKHNFEAFCRIDPEETKQVVRSVDSIVCSWPNPHELVIKIKAHSFLRYQIRRMVGAAFEVARKRRFDSSFVVKSLETGQSLPAQICFNAPGCGLCLERIVYKDSGKP